MNTKILVISQGLTTASRITHCSHRAVRRGLQIGLFGLSLMVASVAAAGGKIIVSDSGTVATTNLKSTYEATKNPVTTFTIADGGEEDIEGLRFTLSQAVSGVTIWARVTRENDPDFEPVEGSISDAPDTGTPYVIPFTGLTASAGTYIVDMRSDSEGATPAVRFTSEATLEEDPFCSLPSATPGVAQTFTATADSNGDCKFLVPEGVSEITVNMWGGGGAGGQGNTTGGSNLRTGGGGGGGAWIGGDINVAGFQSFILAPGAAGQDSTITGLVSSVLMAAKGVNGKDATGNNGSPGDGGEAVVEPPFDGEDGADGNGSSGGDAGGVGGGLGGTGSDPDTGEGDPGIEPGGGGAGGSGSGSAGGAGGAGKIEITYTIEQIVTGLQFTQAAPGVPNPRDLNHKDDLTLTVGILDQFGGAITNDSGSSVVFSQTSGDGSVTGLGPATTENGVASLTITGDRVGLVTVTATLGELSEDFEVNVEAIKPSQPVDVQVTPEVNGLRVSWSAPVSDGGASIVSYTATANPSCQVPAVPGETEYSCLISPLDPEQSYQVMVTATNGSEVSDPAMAGGGNNGGSNGGSFQPLSPAPEPLPVPALSVWALLLLTLLSVWVAGQRLMSRRSQH